MNVLKGDGKDDLYCTYMNMMIGEKDRETGTDVAGGGTMGHGNRIWTLVWI